MKRILHFLNRSLKEHPNKKEAPSNTEITTNNTDHSHARYDSRIGFPCLGSTGTMPAKGPEYGSHNKKRKKYNRYQIIVRRGKHVNISGYTADTDEHADLR
tara:strand:- start:162 stop:464 length:303 start_codon:yes stop_codon:yes gene_type:complete